MASNALFVTINKSLILICTTTTSWLGGWMDEWMDREGRKEQRKEGRKIKM